MARVFRMPGSVVPGAIIGSIVTMGLIVAMLPSHVWFSAVDLIFAYIPAVWIGQAPANRIRQGSGTPA